MQFVCLISMHGTSKRWSLMSTSFLHFEDGFGFSCCKKRICNPTLVPKNMHVHKFYSPPERGCITTITIFICKKLVYMWRSPRKVLQQLGERKKRHIILKIMKFCECLIVKPHNHFVHLWTFWVETYINTLIET